MDSAERSNTKIKPSNSITSTSSFIFISCVMVMLATAFSPPLLRMFGSQIWHALGITEVQWSILLALRGFGLILFVLFAGVAGDLFGVRRVLQIALWCYLVSGLAALAAPSINIFSLVNILLGVIGTIARTINITILLISFKSRQRIFVLVIYSMLYLFGFILSPLLAEKIGMDIGARWAYLLPVGLTTVSLGLSIRYIPYFRAPRANTRDVLSVNVWTLGLCVVIFSFVLAGIVGWASSIVISSLTVGVLLLLGLNWFEVHSVGDKWKELSYFRRQLGIAVAAGIILNLSLYSVAAQIFNFFERIQNFSAVMAAVRLAPLLIGAIFFSTLAARLNIRVGARGSLALGLLVIAASAIGFSLLQPKLPYGILAILLILVGFGFILGNTPRLLLLNASVPVGLTTTGQAIGGATSQLAGALSYALMLTLIQGFSLRAFVDTTGLGLTSNEIASQFHSLAGASGDLSTLLPSETDVILADIIVPGFEMAYTKGLSQAFLVLAGICVFMAIVVWIGLSTPRTTESNDG